MHACGFVRFGDGWRPADCKRFDNCVTVVCPVSNHAILGFLEVSLPSLSPGPYCLFGVLLLRVRIVARHVCAPGFVVEASIFLTFSQFHHSGNAQIIGAPCEDLLHPTRMHERQFNNGEKEIFETCM